MTPETEIAKCFYTASVGHGPSLHRDERRLDDRHRPFMPEWQLRAIELPLGRVASTPAVDPEPSLDPPKSSHREQRDRTVDRAAD